ncbi:MAG: DUF4241 domain-containing protein [Oscillospiraceae bacterium]|nr:DUF4241 domain-containing protein [Oscillospiraceae bacterium]
MNKKQVKTAEKALTDWLINEYGQEPLKMECTHDFEMDGLTYYVFKFQKEKRGGAFVGVCGGFKDDSPEHCGHIFGTFDDLYTEDTALDMGRKMAAFIRDFQQRSESNFEEMFKANLDFISRTEIETDIVERQFVRTNTRFYLTVGTVDIPTGRVVAADPLCYLSGNHIIAPVLEREIPPGSYPAEVALFRNPEVGIRMCTARLKISDNKAVRYELAKPVPETAAFKARDGVMTGFPVDAGMMCFCDEKTAGDFALFIESWHRKNPGKNHYDDYFAAIFAESYNRQPQFQREGGDLIEWANPETNGRMVMIASGLGDGFYQCYWGIDKDGGVCELIVPMVNPDIFEN